MGLVVWLVVAVWVLFWPVIVGVVVVVMVRQWVRRAAARHAERVEGERRRLAGLVARADQQHDWVMQGDPRGIFVESLSAPM